MPNSKCISDILKACSVLPALVVLPAVADVESGYNLTDGAYIVLDSDKTITNDVIVSAEASNRGTGILASGKVGMITGDNTLTINADSASGRNYIYDTVVDCTDFTFHGNLIGRADSAGTTESRGIRQNATTTALFDGNISIDVSTQNANAYGVDIWNGSTLTFTGDLTDISSVASGGTTGNAYGVYNHASDGSVIRFQAAQTNIKAQLGATYSLAVDVSDGEVYFDGDANITAESAGFSSRALALEAVPGSFTAYAELNGENITLNALGGGSYGLYVSGGTNVLSNSKNLIINSDCSGASNTDCTGLLTQYYATTTLAAGTKTTINVNGGVDNDVEAYGIRNKAFSDSLTSGGNIVSNGDMDINIVGDSIYGIYNVNNSAIDLAQVNITATGKKQAVALYVENATDVVIGAAGKSSSLVADGDNVSVGVYVTDNGHATLNGDMFVNGGTAAVFNDGALDIVGGTTTIANYVAGSGTLAVARGATLDIGTAIIEQGTVNIDGTLRAAALNSDEFGQVITDSMNVGDDALLNLTVGSVGTYKIFNLDNDIAIDAGTAYVAQNNGADGIVITTRAVEDIAANAGVSTVAAGAIAGLANSGDATLNIASLNAQLALARGDTDYIEAEAAKAHPEQKPVAHSVATSVQNQVLTLAANRMSLVGPAAGRNGGDINADYGVWAQGLFNKSKFGSQFHGYTRGVAFGADAQIERDYVLGLGYAFSNTDVHSTGRHTDIDSHTLFLYSQYKPAAWYINSTLNYTLSKYDESFTAFGVPFSDKHDVDTFGAQVAAGYDFISGITPEVGLRYLYITQDDYNNGLARVKGVDSNFLTGMAGLKYAFTIKNDAAIKWRPELRAAATYDFVSDDVQTTVLMPGAAPYVVDGDRLSRFGGEFGLGLTVMWRGLELSVIYDLDLHEDYTSQTGMLKFRYEF